VRAWLIRIEHRHQLGGFAAISEFGESLHRPDSGIAYIGRHSHGCRRIALDITRLQSGFIERAGVNSRASPFSREMRFSSTAAMARFARAGSARRTRDHSPGLSNESMRHSLFDAEPNGVPSSKYPRDTSRHPNHPAQALTRSETACCRQVAAPLVLTSLVARIPRKSSQCRVKKPTQPYAFALPSAANPVHPSVPGAARRSAAARAARTPGVPDRSPRAAGRS